MHLSIHDRTLLRGMVAGAVALAGVSACSRSDRADVGPAAATDTTTRETVTLVDSAPAGRPGERIEPNEASQEVNADTVASQADSGRIRPAEDSTEALGQVTTTDTTASGYEPMARDTSTALAEGDTTGQGQIESTQTEADTTTLHAQMDTSTQAQPEVATEVLGNVTADRPEANSDVEAIGDEEAVSAAQLESTGNIVTGAEAVALISRGGQPCQVVKSEDSSDVQWDLASSPATLNPCGTGTMTLPKVKTGEEK